MSTDPTPPPMPSGPPPMPPPHGEGGAAETAEKAMTMARAGISDATAAWMKLDRTSRIYLGGLAVTIFCCVLFDAITVDMKLPAGMPKIAGTSMGSISALEAGATGKLAVLSAMTGIGLWVWNRKGVRNAPWLPLAFAVAAGFSAFMLLALMMRSGGGSTGLAGMVLDVDMTLFGFWVPLLGAIAATVVSVRSLRHSG